MSGPEPEERENGGEDPFLDYAAQIADGQPLDWEAIERDHPADAEIIEGLKQMERLLGVQRASAPAAPANPIGVWGHLQLVEVLAKGAFGEVYRAFDPNLRIDVALKLVPAERSAQGRSALERCLQEARQLARVRHPNVVVIYGADVRDGRAGIWMELIRGKTLEAHLGESGRFGAEEAARIGAQICSALSAVHAAGLRHRDVKGSNVMREEGGRIVLMDFGAASEAAPGGGGPVYGTPRAAAPELLRGEEASPATDLYGVGVLLYRMVTGAFPVDGSSVPELLEKHDRGEQVPVRERRPDVPSGFADVVERALRPRPEDRFASAVLMERALAGSPRWRRSALHKALLPASVLLAVVSFDSPIMAPAVAPPPSPPLAVEAALVLDRAGRAASPLRDGDRIRPGDGVFLNIRSKEPVWAYVINRDEAGSAYVLHPLPGFDRPNPLPAGVTNRLPGRRGGTWESWRLTAAGGDEEFIVIASRVHRPDLEAAVDALPRAVAGGGDADGDPVEPLRGLGETRPSPNPGPPDPTPVPRLIEEIARGPNPPDLWVARFHLKNPLP